ncbi:hypothetical protein ACEPAF_1369 [Sanghuangporus sanghuang]
MTYSICGTAGRIVSRASSAVESTKKALRQAVSEIVRNLSDADVRAQCKELDNILHRPYELTEFFDRNLCRAAEAVFRHVISSEAFRKSKAVSCYLSMRGEIDTTNIALEILRSGKSLYVPKITSSKERRMDFLRLYNLEDLESLPSGVWGIKEPDFDYKGKRRTCALDDDAEPLDLIVVPGVAFDETLCRLGHGKGYYDVFIDTYSSTRHPTLLALSLREQILPVGQIPMLEHDRKMHAVATSDGIIGDRKVQIL